MMICKDCGRIFTDGEVVQERVDIGHGEYDFVDTCPYCGSDSVGHANEDRY